MLLYLLSLSITCGLQNSTLNWQMHFLLLSIKCLAAPPSFQLPSNVSLSELSSLVMITMCSAAVKHYKHYHNDSWDNQSLVNWVLSKPPNLNSVIIWIPCYFQLETIWLDLPLMIYIVCYNFVYSAQQKYLNLNLKNLKSVLSVNSNSSYYEIFFHFPWGEIVGFNCTWTEMTCKTNENEVQY